MLLLHHYKDLSAQISATESPERPLVSCTLHTPPTLVCWCAIMQKGHVGFGVPHAVYLMRYTALFLYTARRWTVLGNRWELEAETRGQESHVGVLQIEHNSSEIPEGQFFATDTSVACPKIRWHLPHSSQVQDVTSFLFCCPGAQ